MMTYSANVLPLILPVAVITACAVSDAASFKIPNRYVAGLLCAWPITALATGTPYAELGAAAALAGAALLVGFALWAVRLIGAGDVKLIAATTLWVSPAGMADFLLVTMILGGVLALALLSFRRMPLPGYALGTGWLVQLHERERVMPYGVAIAGGAVFALLAPLAQHA